MRQGNAHRLCSCAANLDTPGMLWQAIVLLIEEGRGVDLRTHLVVRVHLHGGPAQVVRALLNIVDLLLVGLLPQTGLRLVFKTSWLDNCYFAGYSSIVSGLGMHYVNARWYVSYLLRVMLVRGTVK